MTPEEEQRALTLIRDVRDAIGDLTADEDLTDEKLHQAYETVFPLLHDRCAEIVPYEESGLGSSA